MTSQKQNLSRQRDQNALQDQVQSNHHRQKHQESNNQDKLIDYFAYEEESERQVILTSDNYLGTINCVLHCLFKILPLRCLLRRFKRKIVVRNQHSKYEGVVIEVLSQFVNDYLSAKKHSKMSSVKILQLLELMNKEFKSFQKRDPFEILISILQSLHEELNRPMNRNQNRRSIDDPTFNVNNIIELDYIQAIKWDRYFKQNNDSPILDMFQCRLLKSFQCLSCYTPKLIFENFLSLSINLQQYPKTQLLNLNDLVRDYYKNMNIQQDSQQHQYYCTRCKQNVQYKKEIAIWNYPNYLIIKIDRFEQRINKVGENQHLVEFPLENLDISYLAHIQTKKSSKLAIYDLIGVVSLEGFLNSNKFQSHAFNRYEQKWYLYENDEKVGQNEIQRPSRHAYILLYQKIDAHTIQYQ